MTLRRTGGALFSSKTLGEAPVPSIHVVENWFEEFRDRERN